MFGPPQSPKVAIASLSIRDFRGIERLELDFRGPEGKPNSLVVLAGPNGCGKTTVLEAALIVAGGSALITGKRGRRAIRRGARDYEIHAELQYDTVTWRGKDVPGLHHPPFRFLQCHTGTSPHGGRRTLSGQSMPLSAGQVAVQPKTIRTVF
jgi:energy-coupling factor transporter ATP-binding protein EcfA2